MKPVNCLAAIVIIFCYVLQQYNADGPEQIKITVSPPGEYFEEGSDVHLSCSADSRPAAMFQWFLNGDLLPQSGSELNLMNVERNQSGNYSCHAFNSKTLKSQQSQPLVIRIVGMYV